MAPATKRLNLSAPKRAEPAAASPSSSDEEADARSEEAAEVDDDEEEQTEDESDEEFEIPPGFEAVRGSAALTRDAVLSEDKELWFFKLPKHLDASALANVSFKVGKHSELGDAVARVAHDGRQFRLQTEDAALAQQLVNAFPQAADRKKFTLAKPFARVFSLVEDRADALLSSSKHKSSSDGASPKPAKKHKATK